MLHRLPIIAGLCLLSPFGCSRLSAPRHEVAMDRLPSDWKLTDLAHAALAEGQVATETRILIWQIKEDDRPLRVESCIVWLRREDRRGQRWVLANLYRHPSKGQPLPEWRLSAVHDAPHTPRKEYDHPPNNEEVYKFLEQTWWEFRPRDGFKLIDAAVCVSAWKEAIGQVPTMFYNEQDISGNSLGD